jgi:small subunit ribosomal protein S6
MSIERICPYEGLFLFPQAAITNLQGAVDHIKMLLERAGAQIISLRKWEERRLAYEIKGNKRGVYFIVYFKARASKMTSLDRDCNLSEELLRVMITRADHLPLEQMEAADGQAELADEIRLRAEAGEAAISQSAAPAYRSSSSHDDDEDEMDDIEPETAPAGFLDDDDEEPLL